MYPYLLPEVFGTFIAMYDLLLVIGVLVLFIYVIHRFEKNDGLTKKQTNLLLVFISISLLVALGASFIVDALFHTIQEGELTYGSVTFLGGLIGGVVTFFLLYRYLYHYDNKDFRKVMNTIIPGVVIAHAFGRIGCFFAGCCFGIPTDSVLGVVFPHGHAHDIYESAVLPTQLFESAFLFGFFIVLDNVDKLKQYKIETYVIVYGLWRIIIEFFRGDDRGSLIAIVTTTYNTYPTPSQLLSFCMILFGVYLLYKKLHTKESVLK